jgi:anaerobic selenocysteine-containing dehydrogenase
MKREADGVHRPIAVTAAMDMIAAQLKDITRQYGSNKIAIYLGTYTLNYPATTSLMTAFMRAIGSPMIYSGQTIDQPGKEIAAALLGGWEAGTYGFRDADVWMIFGGNPMVANSASAPVANTPRLLSEAINRGMKLIVADPRKTQTAARADLHIQLRPGEDATILAGMLRAVLTENLQDQSFLDENVAGLTALRSAVEPFTPSYVAARAGIPEHQIHEAVRLFTRYHKGFAMGATGLNMSGRSSLNEYLLLCLNAVCGKFLRAGEAVPNPGVLLPTAIPKAQPIGPRPAVFPDVAKTDRGLPLSVCGMPACGLAEEIMAGKIRALISVGGNPAAAFPDQARTITALKALDLFVQIDIRMSASSKLAHYVIAPKIGIEVPGMSYVSEMLEMYSQAMALPEPFGMYAPKLVDPPPGSDLIEEWEFFYGLGQRLGLQLDFLVPRGCLGTRRVNQPLVKLDMENKPTTDELFYYITKESRIALDEVKKHRDGALFPETIVAAPRDPTCTTRMDVGNGEMMSELVEVRAEGGYGKAGFPFLLVGRRLPHVYNSSGRDLPSLIRKGGSFNPLYAHPDDLAELGIQSQSEVLITSPHGSIPGIAVADGTLRRGVVAMTHCYGSLPTEGQDFRVVGSNTSQLTSVLDDFDRHTGIPRMSAIPVRIAAGAA